MLLCFVLGLVNPRMNPGARNAALTAAKAPVGPRKPSARCRPDLCGDRREWRCWACFDRWEWRCCWCLDRRSRTRVPSPPLPSEPTSRPIGRTGPSGTSLGLGPRASCGPLQPGNDVPAGVVPNDPDGRSHSSAIGTPASPTVYVFAFPKGACLTDTPPRSRQVVCSRSRFFRRWARPSPPRRPSSHRW